MGLAEVPNMKRVKLNPETMGTGKIFKIITISLTLVLNGIVLVWLFFFSGLIK